MERFVRSEMLLGQGSSALLAEKRVAVLGIGGVGSYAVEALARSGVGHLLLVDHDTLDPSNLNRQLPALDSTLGLAKTVVVRERVLDINPSAVVETKEEFCLPENIDILLSPELDYIIDTVDTVAAKIAIADYGYRHNIPVISGMGAGNKLDPTQFQVADLFDTSMCPLCRVMRRELRRRGIPSLKVVYSTETPLQPDSSLLSAEEQQSRRSTPGSVAFVPSVAGLIVGGEVVKDLLGIPSNQKH